MNDDLRILPSPPLPAALEQAEELRDEYRSLRQDITGRGQSRPIALSEALQGVDDDDVVRAVDPRSRRQKRYTREQKEAYAQYLRDHMTLAEWVLWQQLQHFADDGIVFQAQALVHGWIVDFYCEDFRLVIEVDGGVHNNSAQWQRDQHRNAILRRDGYTVLRFPNLQTMHRTHEVLATIMSTIAGMEAPNAV